MADELANGWSPHRRFQSHFAGRGRPAHSDRPSRAGAGHGTEMTEQPGYAMRDPGGRSAGKPQPDLIELLQ
ncbi:hypothetical protein, partial [Streptomyces sp. 1222.5]|uniref:hypothetical protein n=1 Tax=Streptomyces sp. 1222.5 TaxID=1881026 RepID=UPI003EB9D00E